MKKTLMGIAVLAASITTAEMNGTIVKTESEGTVIHTYISPEMSTMVTSHIIETENKLILIDGQFMRADAKELRTYVDSLNKPVDRVIITHSHPDHWFGLEFFSDLPTYALAETKTEIETLGNRIIKSKKPVLGDLVTDKTFAPEHVLSEGELNIDGVKMTMRKLSSAESGSQLLITLPKQRTMIVQDLCFNNVHLFIGQNEFDSWMGNLEKLAESTDEYDHYLVGHGLPAGSEVIAATADYVAKTKVIFAESTNGEDLKEKLCKEFSDYKCPVLLDISNSFLYPQKATAQAE